MGQHRSGGDFLLGPQITVELNIQRRAGVPFVPGVCRNAKVGQQALHLRQAAARQANMLCMVFGTSDDARLAKRGQSHSLGLVELRVLERGKPQQSIAQAGRQLVFGNIDLVAEDQFQGLRQRTDNRRFLRAAGR